MSKFTSLIQNKAGRAGLILKKNSPDILIIAGAVGVITSVVLACKATLKVDEIKKESKEKFDEIEECRKENDEQTYSEEDMRKDKMIVMVRTAGRLAKTYAPAAITLGLSLGLIFKAHGILKARNAALGAAYAAIDTAFKKYRERAIEKFGEDVDKQLRFGLKEEEITVKDEDGNEKKETIVTSDVKNEYSEYARVFDESSKRWEKDAEYNLMFLRRAQDYFNYTVLPDRGHVFLNEVYDYLDLPRSRAGQIVGWVKDSSKGDGKIDFGIYDPRKSRNNAFINGYERNIILDFNVDGPIFNQI